MMKLTKFVHACLLAEADDTTVLFDPGIFSWESGIFDVNACTKLDAMVITHEHEDHFYLPFVKALAQKFPDVHIVTTPSVASQLHDERINNVSTDSWGKIKVFSTKKHAALPPLASATPENIAVHFADRLTVGGDRHDLEETKEILAFTMTAPWGSVRAAAEMVLRLRPRYALPLHDWHWHEKAKQQQYERFKNVLGEQGITFIEPKDGEAVEL